MNKILLQLAREAINDKLNDTDTIKKDEILIKYPEHKQRRATFVTLNKYGELRGCIGSLEPHRSLLDDLISNAKAAAFHDPRFMPLGKSEFDKIEIEVSILSVPKLLEYDSIDDLKSKVRVGVDGIVLKHYGYQATFLPQVWEQLPTFELFFAHLCQKAGLAPNCLEEHPLIEVYQVEKIKEGGEGL